MRYPSIPLSGEGPVTSGTPLTAVAVVAGLLAVRLPGRVFVDPFGGLADLEAGRIRTPGSATMSFTDDPLRMMRAARFTSQLGLDVDPGVEAAMTEMADRIAKQEKNFKDVLSPYHLKYWSNQGKLMSNIGVLLPAVGGMLQQGSWLIPLMNSSSDLFELLTADMVSLGSAIHGGSILVNKNLAPFLKKPVVKVDSVTNTAGQDVSPGAIKVLRLIGQAR